MRIQVSGKQIDVGEALQSRVAAGLTELAGKYAGRPTEATVTFSRDAHLMCCEIAMRLSTGLTAQASAAAEGAPAAFDAAREKMAKQLRRHKRRLKDHHKARPGPVELLPAEAYVLAPFPDDDGAGGADGAGRAAGPEDGPEDADGADPAEGDGAGAGPTIIAETRAAVPSLTVGEAVMQMELAHAPVLVFRNERRGGLNVVYRREDGNIGWIDAGGERGEGRGEDREAGRGANAAPRAAPASRG